MTHENMKRITGSGLVVVSPNDFHKFIQRRATRLRGVMGAEEFAAWKDRMPSNPREALWKNLNTLRHILALLYMSTQTKTQNVNPVRMNPALLTLRKTVNIEVPAPKQVFADALRANVAQTTLLEALQATANSTAKGMLRNEDFATNLRIISKDYAASLALIARMEGHFQRYGMDYIDPKFRGRSLFEEQILALMEAVTRLDFSGREWAEVSRLLDRDEEKILASASVLSHAIGGVNAQHVNILYEAVEEFRMNRDRGLGLFYELLCSILVQGDWVDESMAIVLVIGKEAAGHMKNPAKLDFVGSASDLFAIMLAEDPEGRK